MLRLGSARGDVDTSAQASRRRLSYSFLVHSYSSLCFKAHVSRTGDNPGSDLLLTATLSEYELPVEKRATVWAEMTRPDGSTAVVALTENDPGRFTGSTTETLNGLYRFRVRARGTTLRERPFTREQTLTTVLGRTIVTDPGSGLDLCRLI